MRAIEIKKKIKEKGLKQWQVAEFYGLNEGNFSRLLRKDLPFDKELKILAAIKAAQIEYGNKNKEEH